MAFVLHQAGPPHSHGSRGTEYAPLEEGQGYPLPLGNTSVRAAFVHVLGDLLQSLGVLAASILIYFKVPLWRVPQPPFPVLCPTSFLLVPSAIFIQLPASQGVSFPLCESLRIPLGSVCQDEPRASSKRRHFLYSLSTRRLTPSARSSSLSVPLDPQPLLFEMFCASSWKVNSILTLPPWAPSSPTPGLPHLSPQGSLISHPRAHSPPTPGLPHLPPRGSLSSHPGVPSAPTLGLHQLPCQGSVNFHPGAQLPPCLSNSVRKLVHEGYCQKEAWGQQGGEYETEWGVGVWWCCSWTGQALAATW